MGNNEVDEIQSILGYINMNEYKIQQGLSKISCFISKTRRDLGLEAYEVAKELNINLSELVTIENLFSFSYSISKINFQRLMYFYENYKPKEAEETEGTEEINKPNEPIGDQIGFYTKDGFANPKKLSRIIKYYRREAKLTQKKLSQLLMEKSNEFTENTINQCERALGSCTLIRRYWLAKELGINFKNLSTNQKELNHLIKLEKSFNKEM